MWMSDLALYLFIFTMLIAAAYATSKKEHVSVDVIRNMIVGDQPRLIASYGLFLNVAAIAALIAIFPVLHSFMLRALKYPEFGTLVPWFNTSWLQETLYVSFVLVLYHLLVNAVQDAIALFNSPKTSNSVGES